MTRETKQNNRAPRKNKAGNLYVNRFLPRGRTTRTLALLALRELRTPRRQTLGEQKKKGNRETPST